MSEETIQNTGSQEIANAAVAVPVSFLDSLPEELRNEPSLRTIPDVPSLAKSFVNGQRLIGAEKIPLPGKNATDEDWRSVYKRLGLPDTPDHYEVKTNGKMPDSDLSALKSRAYEAGLNSKQVQAIASLYEDNLSQSQEALQQSAQEADFAGEQLLRQEYGKAFDREIRRAQSAAKAVGIDLNMFDTLKLSDGSLVGNNPDFIRMFVKIADMIGEDTLEGATSETVMTPHEAKQQIAEMTSKGSAYWNKHDPKHDEAVKQVLYLREFVYPSDG
jgi:hypothetical protein